MEEKQQSFVCIAEEEFERLKNNENLFFSSNYYQNANIQNINKEIEQEIKYKLDKINRRQTEYELFVYNLNGDLKALEIENQNRIKEQNKKFQLLRSEYYGLMQQARDEYIDFFAIHDQKVTDLINEEKKARNIAFSFLENKINSILNDAAQKKERVNKFISELIKVLNEIEKIPHEVFAKNKLEIIKLNLPQVIQDYESGFFETAMNGARQIYKQLVDLREFVLQKEQEYLTIYYATLKKIKFLSERIIESKKLKTYLNNIDIEIDNDFWTYDNISLFEKEINKLSLEFEKHTNQQLYEIENIFNNISEKEKKFESILDQAKQNIIFSQIRFNIAQKIATELKKNLFFIYDSGYVNNDPRSDYFVDFKNRINERISILIRKSKKNNEVFIEYKTNF